MENLIMIFKSKKYEMDIKSIKFFFIVNGCIPYKFYKIFKEYLNMTKTNKDSFLLFNSWNNYKENSFLEPNEEFGYSYLNYFSKAIFKENIGKIYDLHSLNNKSKIAIQVHLFYEDLIEDIVNKINNIPTKFDLFITITSPKINNFIKNFIKKHSKANYFEILIVENKGRDILPFLNQIKTKFRSYKYLCHIHSKKSKYSKRNDLGVLWRNYLLQNLLGNTNIISEILYDFQNNRKLGFIFPETFYLMIKQFGTLTNETRYWMDFVASKLFPKYKLGKLINFPAGNMFWAKIDAIYQIFLCDLNIYFPKENGQINDTIMHGIERIWLYLVKFNGFYYKSIFKFF
jgi:lipopolysaccharide biosynthesis protein